MRESKVNCIFTTIINASKKYPKRIKTHSEGPSVNYVYQEKYTEEENVVLAAQNFAKLKNREWLYYGNKTKRGYVFIHMSDSLSFDKDTAFYEMPLTSIGE